MAELAGIGQYKTVDPKFVRSAKAEASAIKDLGLTKEYIESRGGIDASGYYGDSWRAERNLTPAEYDAAVKGAAAQGLSAGAAINQATAAKQGFTGGGAVSGGTPSSGGGATPKQTYTAPDGRIFTSLDEYNQYIAKTKQEEKTRQGQSAYNLLFDQFNQFGMGALVEPLKGFITEGLSPAEFTLRLRETDAYKKRFAANAQRINKGLRALSEAEYVQLEDQYQNVMRNYGLPASYYARGEMGAQQGFEKFIGGDVSAAELEDRISNAQERVLQSAPQVKKMLQQFYPDITNGDILAYALDPQNALNLIKRRITAAEIGAGAAMSGLTAGGFGSKELEAQRLRAEELGRYGVTGEQARQGFQAVAEVLPTATKLGEIYAKQGMGPFTQETAEQEVFGITGAAEAAQKRRKLQQLETAAFSGTSGAAGGALGRERAGAF
jgi:hypothetical protein